MPVKIVNDLKKKVVKNQPKISKALNDRIDKVIEKYGDIKKIKAKKGKTKKNKEKRLKNAETKIINLTNLVDNLKYVNNNKKVKTFKELNDELNKRNAIEEKFNVLRNQMSDDNVRRIGDIDLSKYGDFKTALETIIRDAYRLIRNFKPVLRIGDKYYTLNNRTIEKLLKSINKYIIKDVIKGNGSDAELLKQIVEDNPMIHIIKMDDEDVKRQKIGGAFFKWTHKLKDVDFSELGIFSEVKSENYDNNCLYEALKYGGLDELKLNKLKTLIINHTTAKSKINLLCEKLDITINLTTIKDHNRIEKFGKNENEIFNIGLVNDHYFVDKIVNITSYAINNYNNVKDFNNYTSIFKLEGKKPKRDDKRFISSIKLVQLLIENKDTLLDEITNSYELYNTNISNVIKDSNTFETLEYTESSVKLFDEKIEDEDFNNEELNKITFDFETSTEGEKHKAYLCCTHDMKTNKTKSFIGSNCARDLLESLKGDTFMIAHNAGYDFKFLLKYPTILNYIDKSNSLMSCTAMYYSNTLKKNIKITIHDSYKFITNKLSDFAKMFNLDQTKEVMPYKIYTEANILKKFVKIDDALRYVLAEDKDQFLLNIKKWKLFNSDKTEYDIIKYSEYYCKIDCEVLAKGYETFRKQLHEVTGLNIDNYISLASVADKYLKKQGCYDGVYSLSGTPMNFIMKCVVGGRTMVTNNEKVIKLLCLIADFDAVSLYPSAMLEMKGFLMGKPKVIIDKSYNFLKKQDGYFVRILIKKVNKNRAFPLLNKINDSGVRMFTNDMENEYIYVDKNTLEDAIEYQHIEFDVIEGYYFNDGHNKKINKVIEYLFNKRIDEKKLEKDALAKGLVYTSLEKIYKLLMNSSYGKSILKPIETETKIFKGEQKFMNYLSRNFNYIKEGYKIADDKYIIKEFKSINEHFNYAHIGCEILSQSKKIMNRVMCLAEDNGINIYYQDTDSMHMDSENIPKLSELFKEKYGKELIGEKMGQFHSDFDIKGCKDVKSTNFIALGKKSYIDVLEGTNKVTGKKETDYHIRMKGISNNAIMYYCEKNNVTPLELYQQMYDGESITFDLLCGGKDNDFSKPIFKKNKDMTISNMESFERVVSFKSSLEENNDGLVNDHIANVYEENDDDHSLLETNK